MPETLRRTSPASKLACREVHVRLHAQRRIAEVTAVDRGAGQERHFRGQRGVARVEAHIGVRDQLVIGQLAQNAGHAAGPVRFFRDMEPAVLQLQPAFERTAGDFSIIMDQVALKCAAGQLAVVCDARNAQTDVARIETCLP